MEKKWYTDALMLNRDGDWVRFAMDSSSKEACQKSLEDYFSIYTGNITDVLLCIFCQSCVFPTDAITWKGEKFLWKTENGVPVDYKVFEDIYKCYAEYNVDPLEIFVKETKKKNIRPWITLRMNDVHGHTDQAFFERASMYYEEQEAGHMLGPGGGYFANYCYSFKYPRYKNALKQIISEVLDKYDFFGVELDFMREPYCFNINNDIDYHKIMTEYIREIRELTQKAGERVGHDIKLMIRVPTTPIVAMDFGFDVKTWCEEGLIDALNPAPHNIPTDSAIPVEEWRAIVGNDVGLLPGIEESTFKYAINTVENTKAYMAAFYAGGADGIHLNNFMYPTHHNFAAWHLDKDNVYEGRREFIVTKQDCVARIETKYKPFPLAVNGTAELPLKLGKIKPTDKVTLTIEFEGSFNTPIVSVGNMTDIVGTPCGPHIHEGKQKMLQLTEQNTFEYDISGISTDNDLTFIFNGKGVIYFASIVIDAE